MSEELERRLEQSQETSKVFKLLQCIRGPRLRRSFFAGRTVEGRVYIPNRMEKYADNVVLAAHVLYSIIFYASPLYFVYYCVRYGVPSVSGIISFLQTVAFIPFSFSMAFIVRGVGRFRNEMYCEFLKSLNASRNLRTSIGPPEARSTGVGNYDFEMYAHPLTFSHKQSSVKPRRILSHRRKGIIERILSLPISVLRFAAAHFVARRLVYPGSLAFYNLAVADGLSMRRAMYRKKHNAFRARLEAVDGNSIDCMFIDRRGSPDAHAAGNKLVICCEGNAAFYELGMMDMPISAGYSVLGWNHPGFGDSSGLPFPAQEFNAMDVVVRYAVTGLGFTFKDIIIFAWSIGGYTASCAAMSYPEIGAVIIDGSFDELYPLVKTRIPKFLLTFSQGMVKEFLDLNIAEQLCRYSGPIRIIRRTMDEMMSVDQNLQTNRSNYLLIEILRNRYPLLVNDSTLPTLRNWLKAETEGERMVLCLSCGCNTQLCTSRVESYMSTRPTFPWRLGEEMSTSEKTQLLLFLAGRYMWNYDATHCQPLQADFFKIPSNGNLQ